MTGEQMDDVPTTQMQTKQSPRIGPVGTFVVARVEQLLKNRNISSWAVAAMARLRANVSRPPGVDGAIWDITMKGAPGNPRTDAATDEETTIHAALTLFAVHQQAQEAPMHRRGVGFGRAVRQLNDRGSDNGDGTGPVRRRFDALITAATFEELRYHLRGMVTQLRGASIGFDYGMFADELFMFLQPDGADSMRRRWARQYYYLGALTTTEKISSDSTPKEDNE